jgi:hypothetical protein
MADPSIRLRPVVEDDLAMFRRFATEPGLISLDWAGFRDAQAPARRFATDGYLGPDDGRLMVEVEQERVAAGFVSWYAGSYGGTAKHWEVGIALLPEWRGRGVLLNPRHVPQGSRRHSAFYRPPASDGRTLLGTSVCRQQRFTRGRGTERDVDRKCQPSGQRHDRTSARCG